MRLPWGLQREDAYLWVSFVIFGAIFGYGYTSLVYLQAEDSIGSAWLGIATGMTIGGLAALFEMTFVAPPYSYFRRLAFLPALFLRSVIHFVLILGSMTFWQYIYLWLTGHDVTVFANGWRSAVGDVGAAFLALGLVLTFMQLRMFIGGRQMRNLILGKYHTAQSEDRVFMFVDIVGSTLVAQKIGDRRFHKFLNKLFMLMDEPIVKSGGEVHSYIGDAIIAVWPFYSDPRRNAKVLQAIKKMQEICEKHNAAVLEEFGIAPEIRIAVHAGPVIVGETGSSKRQITYLGNTVNVTARIESKTKELGNPILISDDFLSGCDLPAGAVKHSQGEHNLKGVNTPIALSSIEFQS